MLRPPLWQLTSGKINIGTSSLNAIGGVGNIVSTPASASWPTNNLAIYVPLRLASPLLVKQVWWYNGGTISGTCTVDVGVFHSSGPKLLSSGSTAQTGTNVLQLVNTTDWTLAPGIYYMGISVATTIASTIFRWSLLAEMPRAIGMAQEASAHPLPATMTPAASAQAYTPLFGISGKATF